MDVRWFASPSVWSYGIAALVFGAFSFHVARGRARSGRPAFLLATLVLSAAASGAAVFFALQPSADTWTTTQALDSLRTGAALGFMAVFLGAREGSTRVSRALLTALMVTLAVLIVGLMVIIGSPPPGIPELGRSSYRLGFGLSLAVGILGLVLTEQCYRRTPSRSRWHVRPLVLAFAAIFGYDVVLYSDAALFGLLDENLWTARGIAQAMTVPLFALTFDRTKNWSFDVVLSRGIVAGSTALLASGAYLVLVATGGFYLRYFGGSWGRALEVALLFAALLLLAMVSVSTTFRAKLRVIVAKNFFAYRYDYREEWLRFTKTLAAGAAEQARMSCILALANLVESSGGALWLNDQGDGYRQVERTLLPRTDAIEAAESALPSFLRRTGWVVEISDLVRQPAKYQELVLPPSIESMRDAWLIVPLLTGEELIGFVVLVSPRIRVEIDWEVLDLLRTAGRQASSYLAYAMAAEALLEANKFDAFNRLSAFVVHDLKNLIAQLQLLLSNAERHRNNPEFQRDMLSTVEHVVGKMHQLTMQLRPDASSIDRMRQVDIGVLAKRVQALLAKGRVSVDVDAPAGLLVQGHEDRLERVIGHLVQNAVEASEDDSSVTVRAMRDCDDVVIEVSDKGKGMTSDFLRDRLFKPFQTTKDTGTGIGAYESQQYVKQIGGRIEVESEVDRGTSVRVRLRAVPQPVLETRR
ncbi:MAG TPA: XrtA/PEP-CTERM system histidine kinase PrsK [Burkholderiaceae bacterium]|nr:XrtA/PEP-CTERM system histidine kinase PrsK [Burkholderiaceae bacterium]